MPKGDYPLVFDAHLDLAWNALDWNRDLRLSAADIRRRERHLRMTDKGRGEGTVSFPELRRGKWAYSSPRYWRACCDPISCRPSSAMSRWKPPTQPLMARWPTIALSKPGNSALDQGLADAPGPRASLARGRGPGTRAARFHPEHGRRRSRAGPEQTQEWWDAGLRIIGPAHYGVSPYAHGTGTVRRPLPAGSAAPQGNGAASA